ncbi:hypothetical protein B0H10DRAFT_2238283 [Mycena sp. CBHHK59/15]|nr:hypothetical protein B0H10DRAFT_2238283 [Mycena sp. CBHHK59/15]
MSTQNHHTRAATRAGIFQAPPPIFGTSPVSSSSEHTSGREDNDQDVASPIAALYSTAVIGEPAHSECGLYPSVSDAGRSYSELTPLRRDADFGTTGPEDGDDGGWTPVTRQTARTHRARSASAGSVDTINNKIDTTTGRVSTPSTVVHAAVVGGEQVARVWQELPGIRR